MLGLLGSVVNGVLDIFGNKISNDGERQKLKAEVEKVVNTGFFEIMKLEAKGNWIQRSYKPLTFLAIVVLIGYCVVTKKIDANIIVNENTVYMIIGAVIGRWDGKGFK